MSAARPRARIRLKLPPFGRELQDARRRGQQPNVFIHAGDHAWQRARERQPPDVLCLPDDYFAVYDWHCVKGLAITLVVWGREYSFIDQFARHLILAGASMVCALNGNDGRPVFYRPSVKPR